jgi:single-strand DNA-binding protein
MAFALNRAQVIGNVTRDVEAKQTPSGQTVATFGVATNFSWTGADGQKQDKVEFHNIVAWGKLAEICQQYVTKGRKIFIEGRLQTQTWEGQDGQKRSRTEINATNMILLDGPRGGGDREAGGIKETSVEGSAKKEVEVEEVSLDDLPF